MKTRKILTIVAAAVVIIGLIVGAYFLFFSGKPEITGSPTTFTGAGDKTPDTNPTGPVQGAGTVVAPRLIRITAGPVARGAAAIIIKPTPAIGSSTPELGDTEVRYVERSSGNVYAFRFHDRVLTRIGNKTLPGVLEAHWVPDGSSAFVRFLSADGSDAVSTYALPSTGGEGYFLENGLSSVGVIGSSTVFTLLPGANGSVASVAKTNGTGARTLFSSPLQSLTLQAFGTDFVATTKASSEVEGYAFTVSSKTGGFSRILGPFTGLSTLPSPSGKFVLFSYTYRGKILTSVIDVQNRTVTSLPVATLAEKCAWGRNNTSLYCGVPTAIPKDLPDGWYQGAHALSDRLWKIDLTTRLATLINDPTAVSNITIDMIGLSTDPDEDVVTFMNKTDGSLWAYDL